MTRANIRRFIEATCKHQQAHEARQLVRHFANRAAHHRHEHQANPAIHSEFAFYLAFRSAARLTAQHFKRHQLL